MADGRPFQRLSMLRLVHTGGCHFALRFLVRDDNIFPSFLHTCPDAYCVCTADLLSNQPTNHHCCGMPFVCVTAGTTLPFRKMTSFRGAVYTHTFSAVGAVPRPQFLSSQLKSNKERKAVGIIYQTNGALGHYEMK